MNTMDLKKKYDLLKKNQEVLKFDVKISEDDKGFILISTTVEERYKKALNKVLNPFIIICVTTNCIRIIKDNMIIAYFKVYKIIEINGFLFCIWSEDIISHIDSFGALLFSFLIRMEDF